MHYKGITIITVVCLLGVNLVFNSYDDVRGEVTFGSLITFAGGIGTKADPYQISNVSELQNMSSDLGAHYILLNDIDCSITQNWNSGKGFNPLGNLSKKFFGTFDGRGFTILNLYINYSEELYIGLFGYLGPGANIVNTSLINVTVACYNYGGGMVGYNDGGTIEDCFAMGDVSVKDRYAGLLVGDNGGTIENCHTAGTVSGQWRIGGMVGNNWGSVGDSHTTCFVLEVVKNSGSNIGSVGGLVGYHDGTLKNNSASGCVSGSQNVGGLVGAIMGSATLENCTSSGTVSGSLKTGGLIGYLGGGAQITNCSSSGNVSGYDRSGGLVGYAYGGYTRYCHATGSVSVKTGNGGGLVGKSDYGTVEYCYATGSVSGDYSIGGLAGSVSYRSLDNCHASGDVFGNLNVGGLVGITGNAVRNCSATGMVSGNDSIGGLVGECQSRIENSYALGNVSGINNIGGLVGKISGGLVKNCYSAGKVTGNIDIGGFCGNNTATISDCFFNIQTSCMITSDGGSGKNTSQMKTLSTFKDAGWDFVDTWGIIEKFTYPFFRNFNYSLTLSDITGHDNDYAYEDEMYMTDYKIKILDTNLPGLISVPLSIETNASFLSINEKGILSGTPRNDDVGIYFVNISAEILEINKLHYKNMTLTVHNTNDDPAITSIAVTTAVEDEMYTYQVTASDDDLLNPSKERLTFSFDLAPEGMTIEPGTGLIRWLPTNDDVGNVEVVVRVTDTGGALSTQAFNITVYNTNDPPKLNQIIKSITMDEDTVDKSLDLTSMFYDIDEGTQLLFRCEGQDNIRVTIFQMNGTVILAPNENWNGKENLTFYANDTVSDVSVQIVIIVNEVNDAPEYVEIVTPKNGTEIDEGESIDLKGTADDPDIPYGLGDQLNYRWRSNISGILGKGETLNNTVLPIGNHLITLEVSDLAGESTTASIIVIVLETPQSDTDGDGIPNKWERDFGLDPSNGDDADSDADSDGLSNIEEYLNNTNPHSSDTDNDGLSDFDEIEIFGTKPDDPDTDGDGHNDGTDAFPLDPLKWEDKTIDKKNISDDQSLVYVVVVIVIIAIIIIILFLIMKKKRRPEAVHPEVAEPVTPTPVVEPQLTSDITAEEQIAAAPVSEIEQLPQEGVVESTDTMEAVQYLPETPAQEPGPIIQTQTTPLTESGSLDQSQPIYPAYLELPEEDTVGQAETQTTNPEPTEPAQPHTLQDINKI